MVDFDLYSGEMLLSRITPPSMKSCISSTSRLVVQSESLFKVHCSSNGRHVEQLYFGKASAKLVISFVFTSNLSSTSVVPFRSEVGASFQHDRAVVWSPHRFHGGKHSTSSRCVPRQWMQYCVICQRGWGRSSTMLVIACLIVLSLCKAHCL